MAFRRDFDLDMEKVAAYLQDAVSKIKANPDEFEELRKTFKKNVPLTLRSWVAAYLLKQNAGSIVRFNPNRKNREDFRARRENRDDSRRETFVASAEKHERAPEVVIPEDLASVIFINIGRNRRVFPRDIVGMITNVAGLERDRIGKISILASFTFVQLYKEDAEKVINALNEYEYRGRKLSVNYSRKKGEGEVAEETEEFTERVPDVENTTAPHIDSFTETNTDTMAQQAAFAAAQAEMTDEEILAARAPRSSSTADIQ